MAEFKLGRLKFVWKGTWTASATYVKDDVVRYGGKTYVCVQGHVAGSTLYANSAEWEVMADGLDWKGNYAENQYYKINDVAFYGGSSYVCTYGHTASAVMNGNYWDLLTKGFELEDSWNEATQYQLGDVVGYGGYTYYAIVDNIGVVPTSDVETWKPFLEGFNYRGAWIPAGSGVAIYKTGDVVLYGGNSYLCKSDVTTENPEDTDYWDLLTEGFSWQQNWTNGTSYRLNQAVKFGTSTYICVQTHTASPSNAPDQDLSHTYWDTLADGSASAVVTVEGDIIYRDASGAQRLPIGIPTHYTDAQGEADTLQPILVTNEDGTAPEWSKNAYVAMDALHVARHIELGPLTGSDSQIFIGPQAQYYLNDDFQFEGSIGFTDTKFLAVSDVDSFGQIALKNVNAGPAASTDLIVYTDDGDNDSGWMDMGITSSNFDITSGFGITGKHDGYIFMNAPVNSSGGGNMVIATGENGSERDIVFVTGGFDPTTNPEGEKLRIIGADRSQAVFTGSITNITLTVTAIDSGAIIYDGTSGGLTSVSGSFINGTKIMEQLSGIPGGIGTYRVDTRQEVTSTTFTQYSQRAGVEVYITTESYNSGQGALRVQGGIGLKGNLSLEGEIVAYGGAIYQGRDGGVTAKQLTQDDALYSGYVGLTDASGVFTGDSNAFVQFALKNHSSGDAASTDIIAYASNGDNLSGWIDMGITSENFSNPAFTVTGPDTGYIFMSAPAGTTNTGDLLIGTDQTGSHNDIIIFSNGFDGGNERVRIVGAAREGHELGVEILAPTESTSTATGALRVNGGIGLIGNMNVGGNVNIVGTITIGGEGSSLTTTTLAVTDPLIKLGKGNASDNLDLGSLGIYSSAASFLAFSITDTDTSITLGDASAFGNSGNAYIGDEEITWTGKTENTLTGVTRGANNTTAAAADESAVIYVPKYTGIVRDASDGVFKFITGLTGLSPTSTVNFANSSWVDIEAKQVIAHGNISTTNNLDVGGGNITTSSDYAYVFNTNITDLFIGNSATTLSIGASSGTTTINNGLTVGGSSVFGSISEKMNSKASATGTVNHDYSVTDVFYHSSISANFTANITNVPTTTERIISITLVLAQGATGYLPTGLQIDGNAQTIKWAGNTQPTPQANKTDVVVFTLIRTAGGSWVVLGQMSSYG